MTAPLACPDRPLLIAWIKDLHTTTARQCVGLLHTATGYCCLGRLEEVIHGPDAWRSYGADLNVAVYATPDGDASLLSDATAQRLGFIDRYATHPNARFGERWLISGRRYENLVQANDSGCTFDDIAAALIAAYAVTTEELA